jgi:hypothetical protein
MKAYSSYSIKCQSDIDINFTFQNLWIRNSSSEEPDDIILYIEYEMNSYESMSDCFIHARPFYLNALGILSFLINEPLNVFGVGGSHSIFPEGIKSLKDYSDAPKFFINGHDNTQELIFFLQAIISLEEYDQSLIYSLLDRLRKGYYLEIEDEESLLHYDEVSLIYFHIFEILSEKFDNNQKKNIQQAVNLFTENILDQHYYLKEDKLSASTKSISKTIISLLNQEKGVYTKIMFMLNELDLYDSESDYFIEEFIVSRNSIAHGKQVHHNKAIFPVKPFYPIVKNPNYPLSTFRLLASRLISSFLKSDLYFEEWEECKEYLLPSLHDCSGFLKNKNFIISFIDTEQERFYLGGICNYFLCKEKQIDKVIPFYQFILIQESLNEEFYATNIVAIVLLNERSEDPELIKLCEKAMIRTAELDCNPYGKFRDLIYYLEYRGFPSEKLIELVKSKKIY